MHSFFRGARLAFPIVLGYLPVGFAFGVLAVQAGMTPLGAAMTSLFVFAGSAQLAAANMLASGAGTAGIVFAVFIINLRHLLMSAALAPHLRHWSKPLQAWFAFQMTDETFAANLGRFYAHGVNAPEALGLNAFAHFGWVAGSILGAFFDSLIGDITPWGLDFALPGMFIALIVPHLAVSRRMIAAVSGAAFSLMFFLVGAGQWSVILAALFAATIAAFLPLRENGDAGGSAHA